MPNRITGFIAVFSLVIFITGCSKPQDPDDNAGGGGYPIPNPTACGYAAYKATDSTSSKGTAGATVYVYAIEKGEFEEYAWYVIDTAVTDSTGKYKVEYPAEEEYSVFIEIGQYRAFFGYATADSHSTGMPDTVFLEVAQNIKGEMVYNDPTLLYYYILDVIGTPIKDTVFNYERQFELKAIPSGKYKLNVASIYANGKRSDYIVNPFIVQ